MDGPLLVIDRDAAQPIGVQLVEGLRRGILAGDLRPDDPVPSTRALAAELGVSRSAVVAAYEQLAGEGYLEMRQGAPTARGRARSDDPTPDARSAPHGDVAGPSDGPSGSGGGAAGPDRASTCCRGGRRRRGSTPARGGRPGGTRRRWRSRRSRHRRSAWRALRDEIADHLRQARGVACAADDIVVTAGTSEALSLVAAALAALVDGRDPVIAVEHPGYPSARRTLERRGVRTRPVAVDGDGIDGRGPAPDAATAARGHGHAEPPVPPRRATPGRHAAGAARVGARRRGPRDRGRLRQRVPPPRAAPSGPRVARRRRAGGARGELLEGAHAVAPARLPRAPAEPAAARRHRRASATTSHAPCPASRRTPSRRCSRAAPCGGTSR